MSSCAMRVFHQSTDISAEVNDRNAQNVTVDYDAGQYIYIGAEMPFNNLWWDLSTVNDQAASVSIDIWFGNAWVAAVDITDRTKVSGVSLGQDGRISFSTNRLKGWDPEQDSADVTGLSSTAVYDMYWTRWSWSANLKATMAIAYIGQKFSADTDLFALYPGLNNTALMEAFGSGKSNWNEQTYAAANWIVKDLKQRQIIMGRGQLLDWEAFNDASVHKTAELIYQGMGDAYADRAKAALSEYTKAMNQGYFRIDRNGSGNLEPGEKRCYQGFMTR